MAEYKPYFEKLKDPRWQKRRLEMMELAGFKCQACGGNDNPLHVHHGYYAKGKDPWEYGPESLHVICEPCHQNATDDMATIQMLIGQIAPGDYPEFAGEVDSLRKQFLRREAFRIVRMLEGIQCSFERNPEGGAWILYHHKSVAEQVNSAKLEMKRLWNFINELLDEREWNASAAADAGSTPAADLEDCSPQ